MAGASKGFSMSGGQLLGLCHEHDAPQCAGFIAADVRRVSDDKGAVIMAMGTAGGEPAGYILIDCIHDVEMVITRLRAAADDAFKDQPCTECDS